MDQPWREIEARAETGILIIADHASNRIPEGLDLGIADELLKEHIAIDLGVAELTEALCGALGCGAILGNVSRLVIDFNREEDAPALIPLTSDGRDIPGNHLTPAHHAERIERYWRPYHDTVARTIEQERPKLLISLHSFTPRLTQSDAPRPWQIGILYNQDDRAAQIAIPALEVQRLIVGDQQPYSGKLLNATMNRHGEANGIAYLGVEMRQDEIGTAEGLALWTRLLAPIISQCARTLA